MQISEKPAPRKHSGHGVFFENAGRVCVRSPGGRGAWRYATPAEIAMMPRTVWRAVGYRGE